MGAVTTIPAFLDALRTALAARSGLAGVVVRTAEVPPAEAGKEAVILGTDDIDLDLTRKTLPRRETWEDYTIRCRTLAVRDVANNATDSEAAIKAARDRAMAIFEEVDDYLAGFRGSGGATALTQAALGVDSAEVTHLRFEQGLIPDVGRACQLFFDVRVAARHTPS